MRNRLGLPVLGRIAQTALAAGAAWELALQIPGHGKPFFAPIATVIALGGQRGRRGRQALQMMFGVALGIVVGGAVVAVAGVGAWQLVVAIGASLLVTTGGGASPLARAQAGASAVLVVALHTPGSNIAVQRLVDALIGGGIAIVLAQLLFPVDPLELVRVEARDLRSRLAAALDEVAVALESGDRARARSALAAIDAIDDRRLEDALALAREVARRAPRRRPLRRRIEALGEAWRELGASVADARAIATGALRLLADERRSPVAAAAAARASAQIVRAVDPEETRDAAAAARTAAQHARVADPSLGSGVVAHGVEGVVEHALRAAAARDADRRLVSESRRRRMRRTSLRLVRRR